MTKIKPRGSVEADLLWALVAVQADVWLQQRQRAHLKLI
jgi:hypothetical protein